MKRDFNRSCCIALWVTLFLLAAACTNEHSSLLGDTNGAALRLTLTDKWGQPLVGSDADPNATPEDMVVNRVRVIAFDPVSGKVRSNLTHGDGGTALTIPLVQDMLAGTYNFVVVCNEPATSTADLEAITDQTSLSSIMLPASSFNNDNPIPMVGKLDGAVLVENPSIGQNSITIEVERIAARLAITAHSKVESNPDFEVGKLTGLTLSGFPQQIPLMPGGTYIRTSGGSSVSFTQQQIETLFTETPADALPSPEDYKVATEQKAPRIIVPSWMFSPETTAKNAIKVEATYQGKYKKTGFLSYTASGTADKNYTIRRNTIYRLTIIGEAVGMTVKADVQAWNAENINDMEVDEQFKLYVSTEQLTFYSGGGEKQLSVSTTYSDGWTCDVPAETAAWITVTPQTGKVETVADLHVTAQALPSPLTERTGDFFVCAGNLKKRIRVLQTGTQEVSVEVLPALLTFTKSAPAPKSVKVTVSPVGLPIYFSRQDGLYTPQWTPGGIFPADGTIATEFAFKPLPNNTGRELTALVTVYVKAVDGSMVASTLTIRQQAADRLFNASTRPLYPAAGGNETFTVVNSDSPWQINSVTPASTVTLTDTGEHPAGANQPYSFYLTPNPTWEQRSADFNVTSSDADFVAQTVSIIQASATPVLTDLSPTEVALGNSTSTQQASFKVNCGWTATPDDWATVNPASGSWGNPSQTTTASIGLTPVSFMGGVEPQPQTPAAGIYRGSVILKTTDHGRLTPVQRVLPYTRTVPAYFTFVQSNPADGVTLTYEAHTLTVTVKTNNNWSLTSKYGSVSAAADTYGTRQLTLILPENTTTAERTIEVAVRNGGQVERTLTFIQEGKPYVELPSIPEFASMGYSYSKANLSQRLWFTFATPPPVDLPQPLKFEVKLGNQILDTFVISGFPSHPTNHYGIELDYVSNRELVDRFKALGTYRWYTVKVVVSDAKGNSREFNAQIWPSTDKYVESVSIANNEY